MSNESNNNGRNSSIGFLGLLTIVFITLKLLNVIEWSWIWVLAPIWIPTILVILFLIVLFVILVIAEIKDKDDDYYF